MILRIQMVPMYRKVPSARSRRKRKKIRYLVDHYLTSSDQWYFVKKPEKNPWFLRGAVEMKGWKGFFGRAGT